MKYKTLTRIALRVVGVFLALQSVSELVGSWGLWIQQMFFDKNRSSWSDFFPFYAIGEFLELGFGLYLFFGGKWVLDRIIPSNRPYCHECGYDLSHNTSAQCPECGVATPVVERKGE